MTRAESEAGAAAHPGPSLLLMLLVLLLLLLVLVDPATTDEVHRKGMPKKSARLGPPQAKVEENLQRAAGEEIFCRCALRKGLVHEGHGDTLALTKSP